MLGDFSDSNQEKKKKKKRKKQMATLQQQQQQQQLQKFLMEEQQSAAMRLRTVDITVACFRKCLKAPDVLRLSSTETTCFENCASRHLDAGGVVGPRVAKASDLDH